MKRIFLLSALVLIASCKSQDLSDYSNTVSASDQDIQNGWLNKWPARKAWYTTTQGSHLLDYDIFTHLREIVLGSGDEKTNDPSALPLMASSQVLSKYGFIYPASRAAESLRETYDVYVSPTQKETIGLPFGLVRDKLDVEFTSETSKIMYLEKGKTYLGETCAACHTSQVNVGGKRLVVEGGGATTLDQTAFFQGLYYSLMQTSLNDPLYDDLYARVKKKKEEKGEDYSPEEFKKDLVGSTNRVARFALRGRLKHEDVRSPVAGGPGRSDAVSGILNSLVGDQIITNPRIPLLSNGLSKNEDFYKYDRLAVIVPDVSKISATDFFDGLRKRATLTLGRLVQKTQTYRDDDINVVAPSVSVSIPHVWHAGEQECVQYNCLAQSPVVRNSGEVLGVFGFVELNDEATRFTSTVKFDNLATIEKSLASLESPSWPESLAGSLDQNLITKGSEVYKANCASCHVVKGASESLVDGFGSKPFLRTGKIEYDLTKCSSDWNHNMYRNAYNADMYHTCQKDPTAPGCNSYKSDKSIFKAGLHATDMYYLCKHGPRMVERGPLTPEVVAAAEQKLKAQGDYPEDVFACLQGKATSPGFGQRCSTTKASGIDLLGFVTLAAADKHFRETGKNPNDFNHGHAYSKKFTRALYKARNLDGIAWTGPYLHNGSVRTLAQLIGLEPRQNRFNVGGFDFDPVEVGYLSTGDSIRDTSQRGNSNEGHRYGYELSKEDKLALLEYLKSI